MERGHRFRNANRKGKQFKCVNFYKRFNKCEINLNQINMYNWCVNVEINPFIINIVNICSVKKACTA